MSLVYYIFFKHSVYYIQNVCETALLALFLSTTVKLAGLFLLIFDQCQLPSQNSVEYYSLGIVRLNVASKNHFVLYTIT